MLTYSGVFGDIMVWKAAASAVAGYSADFYEAALLAERVETSVSDVATVGASAALEELFDLELRVIGRDVTLAGNGTPRHETAVCCN